MSGNLLSSEREENILENQLPCLEETLKHSEVPNASSSGAHHDHRKRTDVNKTVRLSSYYWVFLLRLTCASLLPSRDDFDLSWRRLLLRRKAIRMGLLYSGWFRVTALHLLLPLFSGLKMGPSATRFPNELVDFLSPGVDSSIFSLLNKGSIRVEIARVRDNSATSAGSSF